MSALDSDNQILKGPKYPKMEYLGIYRVSRLGIVIMVWGIYFIFGYLDP